MCTPTWRTNAERVRTAAANPRINRDAVDFLFEIREQLGSEKIKIGGLISCKNDCYQPLESLSAAEAEEFHAWQINELADSGIDFLFAATLPNIEEATGIAKAMASTNVPYFISFVIDRAGRLLDGTSLSEAVETIDSETQPMPLGYLVNCAYPTFLCADDQPAQLFSRLTGCQGNASSLDHSELDCAEDLRMDNVTEWGDEMLALHRNQGMKILGGCCGTNAKHLRYIVENADRPPKTNFDTKIKSPTQSNRDQHP
jgi:S-methylmethionine-dependent homocysteine/selenocysteine methylase